MGLVDVLFRAMNEGGPFALGVLGWLAWWHERRQSKEMSSQLLQLATAQIEATVTHKTAIDANTRIMERLLDR